jgi:protein ImuB
MLAVQAQKPADKPIAPDEPFVLTIAGSGGPRIAALNEAAEAAGLAPGEPLADARAKAEFLQVRAVDTATDDAALRRLALWVTRYTPTASPYDEDNGADGFFLDIEGAAHLFGGEEELIADLAARLHKFGLPARLAVASTPGAAWALSRFHSSALLVLPPRQEAEALSPLPIKALRLAPDTRAALHRLGFKTVGSVLDKPRAPFAARFRTELLRRIDQALGRIDEPLVPVVAPPVYHCLRYLLEPVSTQDAIVALARRLMATLFQVLTRDDAGARALRLALYNVDGTVETVDIALTMPTRDADHVARLFALKFEALAATQDAEFGFEAVGLAVTRAERMTAQQTEFTNAEDSDRTERCAALIDALCQRLGPASVRRFEPVASHIPERAEILAPATVETTAWPAAEGKMRPLLLLPQAESAEVTALVPEGPPRRFCWRGVTYDIAGAQGPERIGVEWWREPPQVCANGRQGALTRDYFVVEDAGGHRFWLFREGLYGRETAAARWFVHGLFA